MSNVTAVFVEKDQDWQNGITTYWFEVVSESEYLESGTYGVVESGGHVDYVHEDGGTMYNENERRELAEAIEITDEMRAA